MAVPCRLKTDFEARADWLGVFFKSPRRRSTAAGFQAWDYGLCGLHALRHLLLREACAGAGFDQSAGKR